MTKVKKVIYQKAKMVESMIDSMLKMIILIVIYAHHFFKCDLIFFLSFLIVFPFFHFFFALFLFSSIKSKFMYY